MAEHLALAQVRPARHDGRRGLAIRAEGGNVASVETTGPTVDEAIDAALEKLDLDEDQVELEILSEGGDGQEARVRATPRNEVAAQAVEASESGEADGEVEWDETLATAGREIVEDLLDYMGFPGEVDILKAGKENGTPTLTMAIADGESMGALIGRRGETLQAFQFITQLLVNRRLGHWTRVLLDIEGYRSRRERYLKDTALRAAEKAMRYRESIELDPMVPSERRIVHLTLASHESVTTHSEGEGDGRRVIVEPTPEYVAQHGGPAERSERPPDRGRGGGFTRGGRGGGGGRGRGNFAGGGGGYRR
jgi:spoIIIJ-associated protein